MNKNILISSSKFEMVLYISRVCVKTFSSTFLPKLVAEDKINNRFVLKVENILNQDENFSNSRFQRK